MHRVQVLFFSCRTREIRKSHVLLDLIPIPVRRRRYLLNHSVPPKVKRIIFRLPSAACNLTDIQDAVVLLSKAFFFKKAS